MAADVSSTLGRNKLTADVTMAAVRYRKLMRLAEEIRLDKSKAGRDFGDYIRNYIRNMENRGKVLGAARFDDLYNSISKIKDNHSKQLYPHNRTTGVMGFNKEQMQFAVSNQGMEEFRQFSKGFLRRNWDVVKSKFPKKKE